MSAARFGRAARVFLEARRLEGSEREAFVRQACEGDAELRESVESLLIGDAAPAPFATLVDGLLPALRELRASPSDVGGSSPGAPAASSPDELGMVIGPYTLTERIGEGGFGTVYRAQQEHPVRRAVAVKLIRPGMDTARVVARFEAERRALAVMDHPGIARVFDAGATEAGRPYFAMELFEGGEPITHFCDRRRLTVPQRLELFGRVCRAVQHAHTKGIIHRDLKPSNVLVRIQDGRPAPKVIDFGVAKATEAGAAIAPDGPTIEGQLVGTPAYMSPEQAGLGQAGVDTRTDVYALGVLLYELLAGTTPLARTPHDGSLAAIQRAIRETEPVSPTAALVSPERTAQANPSAREIAACRGTDVPSLSRAVRGDLDWVTLKCLEKEPDRRYQTVNALVLDLERHLRNEPVLAGPPGIGYRAGKFARRHRVGLAAGVAVAAAVVLGLVAALVGLGRAVRAEGEARDLAVQAEDARRRAERAAARAAAVNEFLLQDMLGAAAPGRGGADVRVVDVLGRAADRAGERFADQADLEGEVRLTLANTYNELGLYDLAYREVTAAVERLRAAAAGSEGGGVEDSRELQATSALGQVLHRRGEYEQAEAVLRDGYERAVRSFGPEHRTAIHLMAALGETLQTQRKFAEADSLLSRAVSLLQGQGREDADMLMAMASMGASFLAQRRLEEAEVVYRDLIARSQAALGAAHPVTVAALNNLVTALYVSDQIQEATPRAEELVAAVDALYPPGHPARAFAAITLSKCLWRLERYAEAEPHAMAAYEGFLALGEDRYEVELALRHVAHVIDGLGRSAEADRWSMLLAAQRLRVAGPGEAPSVADAVRTYESRLATRGVADPTRPGAEHLAEHGREALAADHPRRARYLGNLGRALTQLGRPERAESLLLEAASALGSSGQPEDDRPLVMQGLADLYEGWNRPEDAALWRSRLVVPPGE